MVPQRRFNSGSTKSPPPITTIRAVIAIGTAFLPMVAPIMARAQETIHIPHTVTAPAIAYTAKVIGVISPETIQVLKGDKKVTIHLYGVRVPNEHPGDADRARAFLTERTKDGMARVEEQRVSPKGVREAIVTLLAAPTNVQGIIPAPEPYDPTGTSTDQPHGTSLQTVLPTGIDQSLNHAILRAGLATWDRKNAPNQPDFEKAEGDAKKDAVGLWAFPSPVAP